MFSYTNISDWLRAAREGRLKKAMPILSFPSVSLMGVSVRQLVSDSALQAEGMCRVAQRVDAAAAVNMMDLSVEAEAFGSPVAFADMEVPAVTAPIVSCASDIEALAVPRVGDGRTGVYVEAIRRAKQRIKDRPVFAGAIGPYSLAGRLMGVTEVMLACYDEPEAVEALLEKCTQFIIEYISAFRAAGADGVVVAEPLTGMLSPSLAEDFSQPYMTRIVSAVQSDEFAVIYHNCGNNTVKMIDSLLAAGAAGYHFGNAVSMKDILAHVPEGVPVMGNVDPAGQFANGTPQSIAAETRRIMGECAGRAAFIISSGCDIPSAAPWENIDAFFAAAKDCFATNG